MPYFLWKSLDFNQLLCHTDPHCMAYFGYFGGIFFANMGGGGGQNYFHLTAMLSSFHTRAIA